MIRKLLDYKPPKRGKKTAQGQSTLTKYSHSGSKKRYIKSDDSLNYQKIYKDMEEITGFMAQKRREDHYHRVVGLFESLNNGEISHNASVNADVDEVPF